jgi:hypothetical protein
MKMHYVFCCNTGMSVWWCRGCIWNLHITSCEYNPKVTVYKQKHLIWKGCKVCYRIVQQNYLCHFMFLCYWLPVVLFPKTVQFVCQIVATFWDHISVQLVVFTHEMKQELPNIMINRFTFVINNEGGLNTERQEKACPWFETPLCPGAHPEYRCEVWNDITFRHNTKWNIFFVLINNSDLNRDHRDLSFKLTTILGTNAMMLRTMVTILSTAFGLYKGKMGLLGSHCPCSNSPRAVY